MISPCMHMSARTYVRMVAAAVTTASSMAYLHAASAGTALQNFQGNIDQTSDKAGIKGARNDIGSMVGSIINSALGLLGIIFVVLTIYSGYLWMTAQGDDKKVAEAKQTLKRAATGLILIFASYAIVNFTLGVVESGITRTGSEVLDAQMDQGIDTTNPYTE